MGKLYPELDERLRKFIGKQSVFFVATAPCLTSAGEGGHVNLSPKGYRGTFAVLSPLQVAYLDLTGSGAETIAHLRQNGKITIMFCSFGHETKILRLYGTGRIVLPGTADWEKLAGQFPATG
ncbi:MAG TPA: pyridoxamine 5'-phosphate oxidase family protein, partial [Streptosporangiaceae bacterium]